MKKTTKLIEKQKLLLNIFETLHFIHQLKLNPKLHPFHIQQSKIHIIMFIQKM